MPSALNLRCSFGVDKLWHFGERKFNFRREGWDFSGVIDVRDSLGIHNPPNGETRRHTHTINLKVLYRQVDWLLSAVCWAAYSPTKTTGKNTHWNSFLWSSSSFLRWCTSRGSSSSKIFLAVKWRGGQDVLHTYSRSRIINNIRVSSEQMLNQDTPFPPLSSTISPLDNHL